MIIKIQKHVFLFHVQLQLPWEEAARNPEMNSNLTETTIYRQRADEQNFIE